MHRHGNCSSIRGRCRAEETPPEKTGSCFRENFHYHAGTMRRIHAISGVYVKRLIVALLVPLLFALTGCGNEPAPKPKTTSAPAQSQSALIDINRASAEELITLKGIGEARAKAIIRGRPYARKDELVHRDIIPQSVYDRIKDQIIARQK